MTIKIGSSVRSFDFADSFGGTHYGRWLLGENERAAYVEGTVYGIGDFMHHGYKQYKIKVEKDVFGNKQVTDRVGEFVYPPINGTPKSMGGYTNSVEEIT